KGQRKGPGVRKSGNRPGLLASLLVPHSLNLLSPDGGRGHRAH
ncbi:hypothetical protein LEMLEM_LOCUS23005, partial [Lemmus lemmus]